jgi:hypothetical protein
MKSGTRLFIALFFVLIIVSPFAYAEGADLPQQDEAAFFSEVNETGGYVTQKLHQAFWDLMQSKYDEKTRDDIALKTIETLEVLKDFQRATWESAKASYFGQKIEKTTDYDELKRRLNGQGSHYFSPDAIIEHSGRIIDAASSRNALDLGGGKFYITPELIEENLIGIQGSFERLKMLMTPMWTGEFKEYLLPRLNASILALYSPDQYHEVITHNDESIDIYIAQLHTDKHSTYEIGSVDYTKGDKHFNDFSNEEKEIYIREFINDQFLSYRIENPILSKGMWRGYHFVKGVASVDDFNVVIMSMMVQNKAFYIKLVTKMHIPLANADFNDFTKRLQILEPQTTGLPTIEEALAAAKALDE